MAEDIVMGSLEEALCDIQIDFDGAENEQKELSVKEIILGESLLTPGLQTSVTFHSYLHSTPIKQFDNFKGKSMAITLDRPILTKFGFPSTFNLNQTTYRLDSRKLFNNNTEEFVLRACDQTLLNDAGALVSKSWKCASPSEIAAYALQSCAGATRVEIEGSGPARDYIADNIHPFQVVQQQASYALAGADDPSFLHYMTYENMGTHHFKSLYSLTRQSPVAFFTYGETGTGHGTGYPNANQIMTYSFPCDFDLLSDVLNGIDSNGMDINSIALFNPVLKSFSLLGSESYGCGIGSGVMKMAISNQNSAQQQDSCPDYAKVYLLKRQARMGLLEKDKIALRLTVPWNTVLHAGKVIRVVLQNKETDGGYNYGSGDYLIVHMFHHITAGGLATTTMDCVSTTVGQGVV